MAAPVELQFPVDDRSRETWLQSGTEVNRKLRLRFGLIRFEHGFKVMDMLDMLFQQTDNRHFERE